MCHVRWWTRWSQFSLLVFYLWISQLKKTQTKTQNIVFSNVRSLFSLPQHSVSLMTEWIMQPLKTSQGIDTNDKQISDLSRNLKSATNCSCTIVLRRLTYLSCYYCSFLILQLQVGKTSQYMPKTYVIFSIKITLCIIYKTSFYS